MKSTAQLLLLGATLVIAGIGAVRTEQTHDMIQAVLGGDLVRRVEGKVDMTATSKWTSGGVEVSVSTTRGVQSPGDPPVDENETVAEWRARHLARVAAAQDPDNGFPTDE